MTGFQLLEKRIQASAIVNIVVAVFFALIGLGMMAGTAWSVLTHRPDSIWFMGLLGAAAVAGSAMIIQDARGMLPPQRSEIYRIVEREPERIAWIHLVVGKTNGIRIHLVSGSEHTLSANRADSEALFTFLQLRAPQAILGYGPGQQKRYQELVKTRRASASSA